MRLKAIPIFLIIFGLLTVSTFAADKGTKFKIIEKQSKNKLLNVQPNISINPAIKKYVPKPDLFVDSIRISQQRFTTNDFNVSATITVKNRGGQTDQPFKVLVEYTDNPNNGWKFFGQYGVVGLGVGQSHTMTVTHAMTLGTYKIRVTVDSLNTVDESMENNNQLSVGVILGP